MCFQNFSTITNPIAAKRFFVLCFRVIKVYAKYQTTMITFSTTISLISLAGKFVENHCHKTLAAIASLLNLTFH